MDELSHLCHEAPYERYVTKSSYQLMNNFTQKESPSLLILLLLLLFLTSVPIYHTISAMLLVLTPQEGTIELELCKPVHSHTLVTAGNTNHVILYTISYSNRCLVKY